MSVVREYGYEYDAAPNAFLWASCEENTVTRTEKDAGLLLLRSGRDAFKCIARKHAAVILMPALSCSSMSDPFEFYGREIRYYRLQPDYSADIDSITAQIRGDEAELILLYMDYFGNRAFEDADLQWLKKTYPAMKFVYDRTHTLLQPSSSPFCPDYTVASLRKWAAIADGGLLWAKDPSEFDEFSKDISFAKERLEAQAMRKQFFETGDVSLKERYRRVFATVTDRIDGDEKPCGMSLYSLSLTRQIDWEAIRRCRAENAAVLMEKLRKKGVSFIQKDVGVSDLYVPFYTERRDEVQKKLAQKGVFCTVIWPLNESKRVLCETAYKTERYMLAAPCDQRYTPQDMQYIGDEIVRTLND